MFVRVFRYHVGLILLVALTLVSQAAAQSDRRTDALAWRSSIEQARATLDQSPIVWRDGHSGTVYGADVSGDGERIVTSGVDGAVHLWDSWLGSQVAGLGVHSYWTGVEFSPGVGDVILVQDELAARATVWDGQSGDFLGELVEGDELVLASDFLPDGSVVTVDELGVLRVWDAFGAERRSKVETRVAFDFLEALPDGTIVTLDPDGVARVRDPRTGEVSRSLATPGCRTLACGAVRDGRILCVDDDGATRLWPTGRGAPIEFPGEPGRHATGSFENVLSPDGTRLATYDEAGIHLQDVRSATRIARVVRSEDEDAAPPDGKWHQCAFLENGSFAVAWGYCVRFFSGDSGDAAGWIRFRPATGIKGILPLPENRLLVYGEIGALILTVEKPECVSLQSHASQLVRTTALPNGTIYSGIRGTQGRSDTEPSVTWRWVEPQRTPCTARFWNLDSGVSTGAVDFDGVKSTGAYALPGGRRLLLSFLGASLLEEDGRVLEKIDGLFFTSAAISPSADRIALRTGSDHALLVDADGHVVSRLPALGFPAPAFHPGEANYFAASTYQHEVDIRSGFDGARVLLLPGHTKRISHLVFDPEGKWLLSSSHDSTARLWDARSFEEIHVLREHSEAIRHSAFAPSGEQVLTASADGTVKAWDTESGEVLETLFAHPGGVSWVGFNPDGSLLVTCGHEATARLWDATSFEPIAVLRGHAGPVNEAVFVDDGRRLLTWGNDATARVWEVPSGRLLATHVEYEDRSWLTFTPEGYYVAGGRAADWAQVRDGRKSYPLSSFAVTYESPERVAASLAGEDVGRPPVLLSAPELTLSVDRNGVVDERSVHVRGTLSGRLSIERLDVLLTGRLADGTETPPQRLDDQLVQSGLREQGSRGNLLIDLNVPFPENWAEVAIRLRATNSRGVRSRFAELHRRYVPPPPAADARLFLLAIGVENYRDESLRLEYCREDVDGIVEAFKTYGKGVFKEVKTQTLLDEQLTVGNLEKVRHEFLYRAGPNDTIVVYVAGHGVLHQDEYRFLLSGATPDEPWDALTKAQLRRLVEWDNLDASRRVLLIDTCHAGEEMGSGTRGVDEQTAFSESEARVAAGGGLYIITASTARGTASEKDGHGVFTGVLLEALRGKADDNGDGYVDILELALFTSAQVKIRGGQKVTIPTVTAGLPFDLTCVGN